jgi:hypothetical protein
MCARIILSQIRYQIVACGKTLCVVVQQWTRLLVMALWCGISFLLALRWFR